MHQGKKESQRNTHQTDTLEALILVCVHSGSSLVALPIHIPPACYTATELKVEQC